MTRTRALRSAVVTGVCAIALTGCASSAPGISPSPTPTAPSVTASGSTSPSPSPSPSSLVRPVTVQRLAESVLPDIRGYRFAEPTQGQTAALATLGQDLPNSDYVEGGLVKNVMRGGTQVGGVILVRWAPELPLNDAFLQDVISGFAQKDSSAATLRGRPVRQVADARGQGVGALVWAGEAELVLVWSQNGLRTARKIAGAYLGG